MLSFDIVVSDAVDVLLRLGPEQFKLCVNNPPGAPLHRREMTFVVDLKALESPEFLFADMHGSWGKGQQESLYYAITSESIGMFRHIKICLWQFTSAQFLEELGRKGNVDFTTKITRATYVHPNSKGHLAKFIFTCRNQVGRLLRRAIVSYHWDTEPFEFKPGPPIKNLGAPRYFLNERIHTRYKSL